MSYAQTLGMTVLEASPSLTRVALKVDAVGLDMHGTAHGGLVFSLADEAFAVISNLEAQAVAAETHLSFFKAAWGRAAGALSGNRAFWEPCRGARKARAKADKLVCLSGPPVPKGVKT